MTQVYKVYQFGIYRQLMQSNVATDFDEDFASKLKCVSFTAFS